MPARFATAFLPRRSLPVFSARGRPADPTECMAARMGRAEQALSENGEVMPIAAGTYYIVIVKGDIDVDSSTWWQLGSVIPSGTPYHVQEFTVDSVGSKSLNGAFAFEADAGDPTDVSDTSFQYNGGNITVKFAKGKTVLADSDIDITWTELPLGVSTPSLNNSGELSLSQAGTYSGKLTGTDAYKGSTADFTFTIAPIDLGNDVITIAPTDNTFSGMFEADGLTLKNSNVYVNGEKLDDAAKIDVKLVEVNGDEDAVTGAPQDGVYTFLITPKADAGANVVGASARVSTYNVDHVVAYKYGSMSIAADLGTFRPDVNLGFDPEQLSAEMTPGVKVGYTYKVLKDGVEVKSWDEPGEYTLVLETPYDKASDGTTYYGSLQTKFTVAGPTVDYGNVAYYVSIDGKNVKDGGNIEYTGKTFAPVYTLKSAKDTLVQGEDYTVTVTKGDDEVSEIKDPGTYVIHFALADTAKTVKDYTIVVDKATIDSIAPSAPFFAIGADGSAAAPSFVGYTERGQKGLSFDLPADQISVKYYDEDGNVVRAEDLTEAGEYTAEVNIKTTSPTFTGKNLTTTVTIDTNLFADVPTTHWAAQDIYEAERLNYMFGYANSNLFGPADTLTRGQAAEILFNLAGGQALTGQDDDADLISEYEGIAYSTYSDMSRDGDYTWCADSIGWATKTGVVKGNPDGTFAPGQEITREQFAIMLANFAKLKGDYKAVDADEVLSGVAGGDEVDSWAKAEVAWAVSEGIMGQGDNLWARSSIERAQVAIMTVRFQPDGVEHGLLG